MMVIHSGKHTHHVFTIKLGLFFLSLTCFLMVAYVLVSNPGIEQLRKQVDLSQPKYTCTFADTTFCNTEHTFKDLVAVSDFSDILEAQVAMPVTCGTARVITYCQGIRSGFMIQLFKVYQGSTVQLLTRNQYIQFFNMYNNQYGPFHFVADISTGPAGVTMRFINTADSAHYDLQFQKNGSAWLLIAVAMATT
jgi:hypothetical protein